MCTEESSTPTSAHQKTNEHVNENICNLEAKKFRIIQFLNGVGQYTWSNVSFRIIRFEHEEFDTSCRCFWSSSISVVPMSTVLFWFLEALLYVSGDAWKKKVECNYGSELQSLDYSNYSIQNEEVPQTAPDIALPHHGNLKIHGLEYLFTATNFD